MNAEAVLAAARARGWRIAVAESCTGGLLSAALTDVPGASDVFERGFVTYSNAAKVDLLGVSPATLDAHGAVSEPVAAEMAAGALAAAPVDLSLSITGVAGPGGTAAKPEGMVCFGRATRAGVETWTERFGALGRAEVRRASVARAFALIHAAMA